ncbi:hypothetical protein D3C81_795210 [compost metagenome]
MAFEQTPTHPLLSARQVLEQPQYDASQIGVLWGIQEQRFEHANPADVRDAVPGCFGQVQWHPPTLQQPSTIVPAGRGHQCLRGPAMQAREHFAQQCTCGAVAGLHRFIQVPQQMTTLGPDQLGQGLVRHTLCPCQAPGMLEDSGILHSLTRTQTADQLTNPLVEPGAFGTVEHAGFWRTAIHMHGPQMIRTQLMKTQDLVDLLVRHAIQGCAKSTEHAVGVVPLRWLLTPDSPGASAVVT